GYIEDKSGAIEYGGQRSWSPNWCIVKLSVIVVLEGTHGALAAKTVGVRSAPRSDSISSLSVGQTHLMRTRPNLTQFHSFRPHCGYEIRQRAALRLQIGHHGSDHPAHGWPRGHPLAPLHQPRRPFRYQRPHAGAEHMRHAEGDVGV